MPSTWTEKQNKKAEFALNKMLDSGADSIDFEGTMKADIREAAMGKGEEELFEKKLSKEEKKALAKAKRDAKKKEKGDTGKNKKDDGDEVEKEEESKADILPESFANMTLKERKRALALDELAKNNIIVNYAAKSTKLHANAKDIHVEEVSVTFHGKPLLESTEIVINYGNRYGFIGNNGSGKSTIMKAIAARSIPIPEAIDIYFLDSEYEASDKTALAAVFEVQDEIQDLEQQATKLNDQLANAADNEDLALSIQSQLELVYEKLDNLDVNTAESRASSILFGLGFTPKMQQQKTKEFSGGWRMRIALARALFLKPEFLLLDEPTVSTFHEIVFITSVL